MELFTTLYSWGSTACYSGSLIIAGIIGLGLIITFHEFGHFIFAKLFGVHTPSFSIGFGPRIIQKKIGNTVFAISAIPLGGYVEIAGTADPEHMIAESAPSHSNPECSPEQSFTSKPYWQKTFIILGGIIFNFIFAYLAMALLMYQGSPCAGSWCNDQAPMISSLIPQSAGHVAGLSPKDLITKINDKNISSIKDLSDQLALLKEATALITVTRGQEELEFPVIFKELDGHIVANLGVFWTIKPVSLWLALSQGAEATLSMTKQTFHALGSIITERKTDSLGGPIMMIAQVSKCAGMGIKIFLFILAFLSINIAILNILPLPIFDGGQWLLSTIETIIDRKFSERTLQQINYYSWLFIVILTLYLTYKDILRLTGCEHYTDTFINQLKTWLNSIRNTPS